MSCETEWVSDKLAIFTYVHIIKTQYWSLSLLKAVFKFRSSGMPFSYQPAITKKGGEAGGGRVHRTQRRRRRGCTRPPAWTVLSKPMVISTLLRASHTCGKLRGMKCSWLDTILKKSICRPQSAACSLASPSPWILWRCKLLFFNLAGIETPPWA